MPSTEVIAYPENSAIYGKQHNSGLMDTKLYKVDGILGISLLQQVSDNIKHLTQQMGSVLLQIHLQVNPAIYRVRIGNNPIKL